MLFLREWEKGYRVGGKGIDGFASLRYAAGLPPYGLIASLKVPNSFHGLCPQMYFEQEKGLLVRNIPCLRKVAA